MRTVMAFALLLFCAAVEAEVVIDTREAEVALEIADNIAENKSVSWDGLFATQGYLDLKEREAAIGRPFTDDDFREFVSTSVVQNRIELRRTLAEWKRFDVDAAARRAQRYLPAGAAIDATVYPLIKPRKNSFVFATSHGRAIFLYLDPKVRAKKFENTVVHELHHIGYDAVCPKSSEPARLYLGAFGEGLAVLAAAGDARTHPHAVSEPAERAVWDRDVKKVNADIRRLDEFFTSLLDGRVAGDGINKAFMQFISTDDVPQGAFYTVGWTMASTIERARGRKALVAMICDPVRMMRAYNEIVKMPVWSETLLTRLGASTTPEGKRTAHPRR
ncbi:MAG TPA: DUF5700 domain-containing putative Zn-dependent protease [Thermoanaerobaculia bacterium]|nr:DUF5700 domain-containing putative Zn-dependent protease [Thermoanaerobaculia bacterium]